MSRLPMIDYDPEIEIDGIVQVQIGNIHTWYACSGDGDVLIAFELQNLNAGKVCLNPPNNPTMWSSELREIALSFKGRRGAQCVDEVTFKALWHEFTDPYLFPKVKGKIRVDLPLNKDTPLPILADWLQDHECDEAANAVRDRGAETHKQQHERMKRTLDELLADFFRHTPGKNVMNTYLGELTAWAHNQTLNPTELPDEQPAQQQ